MQDINVLFERFIKDDMASFFWLFRGLHDDLIQPTLLLNFKNSNGVFTMPFPLKQMNRLLQSHVALGEIITLLGHSAKNFLNLGMSQI